MRSTHPLSSPVREDDTEDEAYSAPLASRFITSSS